MCEKIPPSAFNIISWELACQFALHIWTMCNYTYINNNAKFQAPTDSVKEAKSWQYRNLHVKAIYKGNSKVNKWTWP